MCVCMYVYIYIYIYICMKPVFKWKQKLFTTNFNVARQLVLRSRLCISANFVDQNHWMWRSERLPDSAVGNELQSGDEPAPAQRDRSVGQLLRHDEPDVHAADDTSFQSAWRDRWAARSQIQIHTNRRGKGTWLYFATRVATWLLTLEILKVQAKVLLSRPRKALLQLHSLLTSALEGGGDRGSTEVNLNYSWRTAPLTSKVAFYIFIHQI